MIKFVCASCGERLSVPDQHGGRKGLCPICQGVNRIPLKGYAETQPNSPTIARNAPASAQTAAPTAREIPAAASVVSNEAEPAIKRIETPIAQEISSPRPARAPAIDPPPATSAERLTPAQPSVSPKSESVSAAPVPPAPPFAPASTERFTSPTKFIAPPDDAANLRTMRRARQEAVKTLPQPESPQRSVEERHLPRKLKIALLILAALAIAGALYFGLLWVLNMAINAVPPIK